MSWGVSPTSDDESIRKNSISLHQDALKVASNLGCKALLFVPGVVKSPISPEIVRYDRALDRIREAIDQLLPIAEDLRCRFVYGKCMEWFFLFTDRA